MKKLLIVFVIGLIYAGSVDMEQHPTEAQQDAKHQCTDSTHANCDGECECDGLECINQ